MEITEQILDTVSDGEPMAVLVKQPAEAGTYPTIAIFHDGPGMRPATHEFAAKLAAEGYCVVVPDLYHRQGRMIGYEPADFAKDPKLGETMWGLIVSLTDDGIQNDLDAALAVAGVDTAAPMGVLGFCLGARAVVRTMTRLPDQFIAGATWHPSFLADDLPDSPHLTASTISGDLYIGIGDADKIQSIAMHQRFFDAVEPMANIEVEVFEGADHGYTWPGYSSYHEVAAETSWTKTMALLERTLG